MLRRDILLDLFFALEVLLVDALSLNLVEPIKIERADVLVDQLTAEVRHRHLGEVRILVACHE